ncbi:aminotransferase class I/II-fold pyridoxal phosphate-dependent enzyme [Halioxenophilus sp. WMMB6]|uniref:aminotransferase class I/II-fold pyridoxal phosphate-dependent enzyme n=1 Tax=Halioxenophilus sp. WMMB6 TaxID=3073815 RepID=UPI00295E7C9C|nr:aminotransferase class I/II-fold pyridoxal phosphate-dependent enzyme [Halioxenophilus sp. WMMB6]
MSIQFNRRGFLKGATALASAASVGGLAPNIALASDMKVPADLYGPTPDIAKLNSNENPYGPSPAALKAIEEASKHGAYYVSKSVRMLVDMIAERHGLTAEQISLSSGSSGILTWTAMAAASKGRILGPDLFWDTTARAPQRTGAPELLRTPKTADMGIDLDAMYDMIDDSVSMVQVTNPNNPTGMLIDTDKLREFCKKASKKTLVLVDEAYNELTDFTEKNSMIPLINEGYNVMVARTFSKIYGLAGMRVGYMMGSPENIQWVSGYGAGYFTLNQAGIAAAIATYNDFKFLDYVKSKVVEAREIVADAVKANELKVLPSQTNFMYVDLGNRSAEVFRQNMEKQKVLIRGIYQDYTNWSRVSMGFIKDVEKYAKAMPKALEMTPLIG